MNYVCKKCHVRQAVKDEDTNTILVCDCGRLMVPDDLATDDKVRKVEGIYGSK